MFKYEIPNPIETRRWQHIVRNDRICTFSRENIGDEFHYLFICKHELIADLRSKFIHKMKGLLSLCNVPLLKNICLFISKLVGFSKLCFSCFIEIDLSLIASVTIYIVLLNFCILQL